MRASLLVLSGAVAATSARVPPDPPAPEDPGAAIELHVGIPGVAYIGQSLDELRKRFPSAEVTPFAGQEDALVVKIAQAGISCYVVGRPPDAMRVASVGFNFDGTYQGAAESGFRTREGIGKGSTVNELLETYGPAEISGGRRSRSAPRRRSVREDPNALKRYLYRNEEGSVTTYFMARGARVLRVVINHNAPLDRHILRRGSRK